MEEIKNNKALSAGTRSGFSNYCLIIFTSFFTYRTSRSCHDLLYFLKSSMAVLCIFLQAMQASVSVKDLAMSSQIMRGQIQQ